MVGKVFVGKRGHNDENYSKMNRDYLAVSEKQIIFASQKDVNMEENNVMIAAESAAALLSEEVRRSGILSQVMKLSQPDKVALIAYLRKDMETEEPFKTDEFGRIKLTQEMRDTTMKAVHDYENGKCLSEDVFKESLKNNDCCVSRRIQSACFRTQSAQKKQTFGS